MDTYGPVEMELAEVDNPVEQMPLYLWSKCDCVCVCVKDRVRDMWVCERGEVREREVSNPA